MGTICQADFRDRQAFLTARVTAGLKYELMRHALRERTTVSSLVRSALVAYLQDPKRRAGMVIPARDEAQLLDG